MRVSCLWDLDDDPAGNVQHIAKHNVTVDEVEQALENEVDSAVSHSTGRPILFGTTAAGRHLTIVYEWVESDTIYVVTAFDRE